MTELEQLKNFIERAKPIKFGERTWIENEKIKVYVRKAHRLINKQMLVSLDLATIEVAPSFQNQGLCSNFIKSAHAVNPFDITFIENVLDENLRRHLIKNDWISAGESFYKLVLLN